MMGLESKRSGPWERFGHGTKKTESQRVTFSHQSDMASGNIGRKITSLMVEMRKHPAHNLVKENNVYNRRYQQSCG